MKFNESRRRMWRGHGKGRRQEPMSREAARHLNCRLRLTEHVRMHAVNRSQAPALRESCRAGRWYPVQFFLARLCRQVFLIPAA